MLSRSISFLFLAAIFIYPAHSINNKNFKLEDLFYLNAESKFPFYWNDISLYATILEKNSRENFDISIFYQSRVVFYANKTGIRVENATHPAYNIDQIEERIGESKIFLFIGNGFFNNKLPDYERINIILDDLKLNKKIKQNDYTAFIPNKCGSVITKNNNNVDISIIYLSEDISFIEKRKCIEFFSPSMLAVKPILDEDISYDEGANYIPELLASSIGYCRNSGQETPVCIKKYLTRVSRKIGSWVH